MGCLDDAAVLRLIGGELDPDALAGVDGHLDGCPGCRALVAAVARGQQGAPEADELRAGDAVGRYVVLGRLGGGAMGVVYAAHDGELDRKVALKLLRPELGAGPERLLREAQAMARLQHPNVVAVHDVGTRGEQVFVAMELVDGPTLRAWAGGPRTWRERRDAVCAIGRGLAAAHAAGLVHRDVKPDNVIVGPDHRPRIGDFGLARAGGGDGEARAGAPTAAAPTTITRTGTMIGTPAYMAPEQLRGEPATAASDQFGLAVTAWEVLYGARPFAGDDLVALAAAIARGPTVPRGEVPPRIGQALARALAVEPAARWPSVSALVDALGYQPPRRWPWLVAGVSTAIAIGAVLAIVPHAPARDLCVITADDEVEQVWDDARAGAVRARLTASGDAVTADRLDGWIARWRSARREMCEANRRRGARREALLDVRQQCLQRGRTELAALVDELVRTGASTPVHLAEALDALTDPDLCARSPALTLRAPAPPAAWPAIAEVERGAATLRARLAGTAPVDAAEGRALVQAAEPTGHAPTIALAHVVHAELLRRAGDYPGADGAARAAIVAAERGHDDLGAAHAWVTRLAIAGERRDLVGADEWLALATAAVARAGDPAELRARLAGAAGLLAMNRGELDQAARALDEALALHRARAGAGPDLAVARTRSALGHVARLRGDLPAARAAFEEALAIERAALGPAHPEVGRELHNLANLARVAGELDAAEARYREALAIRAAALGPAHAEVGLTHNSLALVALARGDLDGAGRELEAARAILAGAGHGDLAIVHANLGQLALRRGDPAVARRWLAQAVEAYRRQLPPRHERLARALLDAAAAATEARDRTAARALLVEARAAIPDGAAGASFVREADELAARLAPRPAARPVSTPTPAPAWVGPPGTYGSAQGWD